VHFFEDAYKTLNIVMRIVFGTDLSVCLVVSKAPIRWRGNTASEEVSGEFLEKHFCIAMKHCGDLEVGRVVCFRFTESPDSCATISSFSFQLLPNVKSVSDDSRP
jgi:hypothetical protein